jgi:predicted nucleotidyltransferase
MSDYNLLKRFAEENDIDFLAVYGSFYTGNHNDKSDLDLIVDFNRTITSDYMLELANRISTLVNRKVDLITPKQMISSLLVGYVWRLNEYKTIYGKPVIKSEPAFC